MISVKIRRCNLGGLGSGRHTRYGARSTTDDYRSLDVRRWQREGLLAPFQSFGWRWKQYGEVIASIDVRTEPSAVTLSYRHRSHGSEWRHADYPVQLDWTACHYGGHRAWFRCPARGCGKRVAILYAGAVFACRDCYRLAYASQRESPGDRAARRADRIRERLRWEPGILNGGGPKPFGMHRRKFAELNVEHDLLVKMTLEEARERFGTLPLDYAT
jgi:hypothetical protein